MNSTSKGTNPIDPTGPSRRPVRLGNFTYPRYPYQPPDEIGKREPHRIPVVVMVDSMVGLTIAIDLASKGVRTLLLDDNDTVSAGSRSRTLSAACWDEMQDMRHDTETRSSAGFPARRDLMQAGAPRRRQVRPRCAPGDGRPRPPADRSHRRRERARRSARYRAAASPGRPQRPCGRHDEGLMRDHPPKLAPSLAEADRRHSGPSCRNPASTPAASSRIECTNVPTYPRR